MRRSYDRATGVSPVAWLLISRPRPPGPYLASFPWQQVRTLDVTSSGVPARHPMPSRRRTLRCARPSRAGRPTDLHGPTRPARAGAGRPRDVGPGSAFPMNAQPHGTNPLGTIMVLNPAVVGAPCRARLAVPSRVVRRSTLGACLTAVLLAGCGGGGGGGTGTIGTSGHAQLIKVQYGRLCDV